MLGKGKTLVRLTLAVCALLWMCIAASFSWANAASGHSDYVALDQLVDRAGNPVGTERSSDPSGVGAEESAYRPLQALQYQTFEHHIGSRSDAPQFLRLPELIELNAQPPPKRRALPFRWVDEQRPVTETLSTRGAPVTEPMVSAPLQTTTAQSGIHGLRSLIGWAEAGRAGYDAVVLSARIKPENPPSQMTLHEIFLWIERTPRQNHAIGRYQFIPSTLRRLVTKLDISHSQRFDPILQDRLANALLVEAGLAEFLQGTLSRKGFMNNLADIWAGLPTSNGKSRYHGYAGNKAVISWHRFSQAMALYFPY